MKWLQFNADGTTKEVTAEEITEELERGARAAAPTTASRDWRPCTFCLGPMIAEQIVGPREFWSCKRCNSLTSLPADPPVGPGELSRFRWSIVRHSACRWSMGGHQHCLPEVFFSRLKVSEDGRAVESPELGRLELVGWA